MSEMANGRDEEREGVRRGESTGCIDGNQEMKTNESPLY